MFRCELLTDIFPMGHTVPCAFQRFCFIHTDLFSQRLFMENDSGTVSMHPETPQPLRWTPGASALFLRSYRTAGVCFDTTRMFSVFLRVCELREREEAIRTNLLSERWTTAVTNHPCARPQATVKCLHKIFSSLHRARKHFAAPESVCGHQWIWSTRIRLY